MRRLPHPVKIFSYICEEKNVSFYTFYRTAFYRQTLALPSREHPLKPAYLCSLALELITLGLPSGFSVWVGYAGCTSPVYGKRRSWSRLWWVSMVRLCWCRASLSRGFQLHLHSTLALLLRVDDTKEDKHSDVQLDLPSSSRLFFSRFSILNAGSVLLKPALV